jgi:hypothetical protein
MSIPSYSPKSQRLQAKAPYAGLVAGTLKRSSIAEQDALLIVHSLARNVQTYVAKANWLVLTLVGRYGAHFCLHSQLDSIDGIERHFPKLVMIIPYELARGLSEPAQVQMSCHLALS